MNPFVLVRNIKQKDNHTFTIEWSDGISCDYRLNQLQQQCPCANCVDSITGKRSDVNSKKDDVRATSIHSIGRYAISIKFTSGCSSGIYDFDLLRQMIKK